MAPVRVRIPYTSGLVGQFSPPSTLPVATLWRQWWTNCPITNYWHQHAWPAPLGSWQIVWDSLHSQRGWHKEPASFLPLSQRDFRSVSFHLDESFDWWFKSLLFWLKACCWSKEGVKAPSDPAWNQDTICWSFQVSYRFSLYPVSTLPHPTVTPCSRKNFPILLELV